MSTGEVKNERKKRKSAARDDRVNKEKKLEVVRDYRRKLDTASSTFILVQRLFRVSFIGPDFRILDF